jgi:ankyrin repeat protein
LRRSGKKVTACKLVRGCAGDLENKLFLHFASARSNLDAVKCLVEAGADVDLRCSRGNTPLHCAQSGVIAQYLVEHKASLSVVNNDNLTPLQCAVQNDKSKVVGYLRRIRKCR